MSTTTTPTTRLHGLDALRAGALLLGIVLHGLMPFVPVEPGQQAWFVQDQQPVAWALPVIVVIHLFRMTLFMVLAGYFARIVVTRRGMPRFLRERTVRIALPVFAMWPLAVAPIALVAVLWGAAHGVVVTAPAGEAFSPGHLWFLWTLYQCCLVLALVRWLGHRIAPDLTARLADVAAAAVASRAGVVVLALPYAAVVLWQATTYSSVEQPQTLTPDPSLLAYLSAFVAGWLLARRADALPSLSTRWVGLLTGAVAGSCVVLLLGGLLRIPAPGGVWNVVLAGVSGLTAGAWVFGLLGLSMERWNRQRFWVRYLADASYWMYLMHLWLLAGIQGLMTHVDLPTVVELVAAFATTTVVLLLTYDAVVRSTWIGAWLTGRRHPRVLFSRRAGI